jgi:hypothetical protein
MTNAKTLEEVCKEAYQDWLNGKIKEADYFKHTATAVRSYYAEIMSVGEIEKMVNDNVFSEYLVMGCDKAAAVIYSKLREER